MARFVNEQVDTVRDLVREYELLRFAGPAAAMHYDANAQYADDLKNLQKRAHATNDAIGNGQMLQVRKMGVALGRDIAPDVTRLAQGDSDARIDAAKQQLATITSQLYSAYNPETKQYKIPGDQLLALGQTFQRDKSNLDALTAQKEAADALTASQKTALDNEKTAASFRRHAIEDEFSGIQKIAAVRAEEMAQYGTTAKARADIETGISAMIERQRRKDFEETIEFEREALKDRQKTEEGLIRQTSSFYIANNQFAMDTAEKARQVTEQRSRFAVDEAGFARDSQLRAVELADPQRRSGECPESGDRAELPAEVLRFTARSYRAGAVERDG